MKEYEMVMVKIVFYECRDVIAMSSEDAVDDLVVCCTNNGGTLR